METPRGVACMNSHMWLLDLHLQTSTASDYMQLRHQLQLKSHEEADILRPQGLASSNLVLCAVLADLMRAVHPYICRSSIEALVAQVPSPPAHATLPLPVKISQSTCPGATARINQTLTHGTWVVEVSAGRTGRDAATRREGLASDGVVVSSCTIRVVVVQACWAVTRGDMVVVEVVGDTHCVVQMYVSGGCFCWNTIE
jgi:hypothetical protein